jgi:phosphohistidine phosphatase
MILIIVGRNHLSFNFFYMKKVLLVRHAKSSWDDFNLDDFERPLNARGKKNAVEMAKRLKHQGIIIDAFLSSPAKRAIKTAEIFADEFNIPKKEIIQIPELYHAGNSVFLQVIAEAPKDSDTIALFSHNPGITEFANSLSAVKVDDMPTSSIFAIKADISGWNDFASSSKDFYFFDYPKSLSK